jgi:membrane-associated phospholipid phosphatase
VLRSNQADNCFRVLALAAALTAGNVQAWAEQLSQAPETLAGVESSAVAEPPAVAASPAVEGAGQTQRAPDPQPEHSGWGALFKNSVGDFGAFPRRASTWVILGGGAGAALLAHPADDYVTSHIHSDTAERVFAAGKWLGSTYVHVGAAAGLYLVGRYVLPPGPDGSRTNKVSHLGFDLIRAQILSQAIVHGIKYTVQRDRPTGECCAFPSGHAASAFAAASVIERHFGYRGAWPTLVAASYVATSRLVDDRHFLSDVVFGAAVGVASGWTVVGTHGRSSMTLMPIPIRGGVFLAVTRAPGN